MFVRDKDLRRGSGDERARVLQLAKEQRVARSQQKEHDATARCLQAFVRGRLTAQRTRAHLRSDVDHKLADIAQLKLLLQRPRMPLPLDALFDLLRKLLFSYRSAALDGEQLLQLAQLFSDAAAADASALQRVIQLDTQRCWLLQRMLDLCMEPPSLSIVSATSVTTVLRAVRDLTDAVSDLRTYLVSGQLCILTTNGRQRQQAALYSAMATQPLPQLARRWFVRTASSSTSASLFTATSAHRAQCDAMLVLLSHLVQRQQQHANGDALQRFARAVGTQILSVPLLRTLVTPAIFATALLGDNSTVWSTLAAALATDNNSSNNNNIVALLPIAPTAGIASATWLLGNILDSMHHCGVGGPTACSSTAPFEAQLLTELLTSVPRETFAASGGVAVAWTHVSDSHAKPIVLPDALTQQLELLVHDRFVRALADALLVLDASKLRVQLATVRPTPMHPTASSIAEQYGFGDIASESSLATSLSTTWRKVKALGRANWARSLLEKTGLRRRPRDAFRDASSTSDAAAAADRLQLRNTSHSARQLATSGRDVKLPATSTVSHAPLGEPFAVAHVRAFATLYTTFLFRWGRAHNRVQPYGLKLLNTLAFYQCAQVGSSGTSVSLVRFLWLVLQETRNFDDFVKDVDLVRASSRDAYVSTLALFVLAYNHLLVVLDDEEMYDDEFPLPLAQVERLVVGLKRALHAAYWTHGHIPLDSANASSATLSATPQTSTQSPLPDVAFGMFVVDAATTLLRDLYSRCSRRPFCNVTSWVLHELDSNQLIDEVLAGTPRANKLIASMPYLVPFPDRVKLFQRLVAADKAMHQGPASTVVRVRIHRNRVLDDGLAKLNVLGAGLKKRINVVFVNAAGREEVGIDAGGLFKEFWLDLASLAFDLEYGLFLTTAGGDNLLYPNPFSASTHFARGSDHLVLFQFVGRILGKALYEGIVVDPKFARFFLSKLLHAYNYVNDLPSLDPEIYKNLMFLKTYDGDVEDLGLTHTIVQDVFGDQREIELLPGGGDIPVTTQNRTRYIHLVANYYLNTQIRAQCAAFRAGLSDLIDVRWLQMFNEPELQVLISGKSGQLDVDDLRAHTTYAGGYFTMDKRVQWLWQALASFSPSEQAAFLRFATSCQRAPSLGFSSLTPPFCVQKVAIRRDDELLPSSSTCFNTLKLPTYSSYKVLRAKLLLSISSGAGFEMT